MLFAGFLCLFVVGIEALNEPSWVAKKYYVDNCAEPRSFSIVDEVDRGVLFCRDSDRALVTFSLNQTGSQNILLTSQVLINQLNNPANTIVSDARSSFFALVQLGSVFVPTRFSWDTTSGQFAIVGKVLINGEVASHGQFDAAAGRFFFASQGTSTLFTRISRDSDAPSAQTLAIDSTGVSSTAVSVTAIAFLVDSTRNRAVTLTGTRPVQVEVWQLANCPSSSNCSSCVAADPLLCNWCIASSASCSLRSSCAPIPSSKFRLSSCPVPTQAVPASASIAGGSLVTVFGNGLVNDTAASCVFMGASFNSSSPAKFQLDGSVTCAAPAAAAGTVSLRFGFNTTAASDNALSFSFYDCTSFTNCTACASSANRDCVWCAVDAVCASRFNKPYVCPTRFASVVDSSSDTVLKCARLISVSPSSELDQPPSGSTVTITTSYLVNSTTDWQCRFGEAAPVTGVADLSASTITCPIPAYPSAPFRGSVSLSLLYKGTAYALNTLSFDYYNCGLGTADCSACVNPVQTRCTWCLSQKTCLVQGSTAAQSCPDPSNSQCPLIIPTPRSSFFNEQAVVTIADGPFTSVAPSSYQCNFGGVALVSAVRLNASAIQCTAPSVSLGGFPYLDVPLSIVHQSGVYANATVNFRFYDCSGTNCSSCAGVLMPRCAWCFSEAYCDLESVVSSSPCAAPVALCPQVTSISSSFAAKHGNLSLTVSGTRFFASLSYNCTFISTNMSAPQITDPATFLSNSSLTCPTPAFSQSGPWSVNVFSGAQLLESPLPLTVIDCNNQTDCSSCTRTSQCSWCPAVPKCIKSGLEQCGLGVPLNLCPSITLVSPNSSEIWRSRNVVIEGALLDRAVFGNTIDSLICSFGPSFDDFASSTSLVGPTTGQPALQCQSPLQPTPGSVNVGVSIIDLNGRVVPYVSGPSFEYFDCRRATDCTSCLGSQSSKCGWCLSSDSCTPVEQCSAQFWTRSTCPALISIQPTFGDVAVTSTVVTITGTKFDATFDLTCSFDGVETNSTFVSSSVIFCSPPRRTVSGTASVVVAKRGRSAPYTSTSAQFEYISCNRDSLTPIKTCRSCIPAIDARCGWCLLEQKCSPFSGCVGSVANVTYLASSCPSMLSVEPSVAVGPNSTTVTVTGTLFQQVAGLTCRFGTLLSSATTVLNSTTLTCATPIVSNILQDQSVQLALVVDGNEYAAETVGFRFTRTCFQSSPTPFYLR